MLRVGITGGIGSGKSLVSGIFQLLGVPVYDSDLRAKDIMHQNKDVRSSLRSVFGRNTYDVHGKLNRKYLADRVFNNKELLDTLNEIVHPAVGIDFDTWCAGHAQEPYIIKEAALIFEAGINTSLDKVILVFAPEELRILRVIKRDGLTEESIRSRIASQWPDDKKVPLSDFIIVNDGDRPLLRQTQEIHNLLTRFAQNRVLE